MLTLPSPSCWLIEQDTFLVCRITNMREVNGTKFHSTTPHTPVINEPVPDDALAFDATGAAEVQGGGDAGDDDD